MTDKILFTIDGVELAAEPGQTIIEAADAAGIYIPRLCHQPGLNPFGSCRVCTVRCNGRPCSACTQPPAPGMVVENDVPDLQALRAELVEMLFVEGNHFCMFCEKSGRCELQALAYRFGILAPRLDYCWPQREVDMSHPDLLIDHNRCILCARCVRTSQQVDGKNVFQFIGRGTKKRLAVNSRASLAGTDAAAADAAVAACPVGALLKKRVGYAVPMGRRRFDKVPIGSPGDVAPGQEQ